MSNIVKQEHVNMVLITPESIEISGDIKAIQKNDVLEIEIPSEYRGILNYKVSGKGKLKESVVINLGKNSELIIFDERSGDLNGEARFKIKIEENSRLSLIEIQDLDYGSEFYVNKEIKCDKNSRVEREVICLGSENIKVDCSIYLEQDSIAKDVEVFFGDREQRFELNTNLIHKGIRSKGSVQVRGVLKDKGYCYSHGILRIDKEAQQTSTYLAEHVLLLSKDAKAQAIPALEIEANDVQAQHSASVTQIDNDQVFYMKTRGLEEKEARKMIVQGFLGAVLKQASEHMQEKWINLFEEKWNK